MHRKINRRKIVSEKRNKPQKNSKYEEMHYLNLALVSAGCLWYLNKSFKFLDHYKRIKKLNDFSPDSFLQRYF